MFVGEDIMKYELNKEQMLEIQKNYCDYLDVVLLIQETLNARGDSEIIGDEETFFEIVASVASRYQNAVQECENELGEKIINEVFKECVDFDSMIFSELKERFDEDELNAHQKRFTR